VSELDGIDAPEGSDIEDEVKENFEVHAEEDETWEALSEDRRKELIDEAKSEKADEIWGEVTSALDNISCD